MPTEYFESVARGPRHPGGMVESARVCISRPGGPAFDVTHVVNVSRKGLQLVATAPLAPGDEVELEITSRPEGGRPLDLRLKGTVRWQERADGPAWRMGCGLHDELDWETLGELFLQGVIALE